MKKWDELLRERIDVRLITHQVLPLGMAFYGFQIEL